MAIIENITITKLLALDIPKTLIKILKDQKDLEIITSLLKKKILITIYERRSLGLPNSEHGNKLKKQIEIFLQNVNTSEEEDIYMTLVKGNLSQHIVFFDKTKTLGVLDIS